MKHLIIAEKPSVAADLSKALGKFKKVEDYYENDDLIIACAVGHLVELFMPQDIDDKFKSWHLDNLPIIPPKFELKAIDKTKKKFASLKKLMNLKEVDCVINACDAGREGELIFTYIYELAKCKKPIKRMWMSSMTTNAIKEAFEKLRTHEEMVSLQEAARCRSESDWLIGINGTRVITSRLFGFRGGQAATVGRVQTPTLTMVVDREKAIRNFVPRPYWRITGDFKVTEGEYEGIYQKPGFKKGDDEHDRIDRIWDERQAKQLYEAIRKISEGMVTEEKKRSKQSAPALYDLTTLQRESNNRFSFSAARTLQIAQALYEKYKVITYPRTDAKALPEDYGPTCLSVLKNLEGEYSSLADKVLKNNWVNTSDKRIFNNKKISDHFAIIPTNQQNDKMTHDERKVYDLIVRRFLGVFYPMAEYDVTTRTTLLENTYTFKTEGRVLVVPGWMEVLGRSASAGGHLPALTKADGEPPIAHVREVHLDEDTTKPPPRYTEATLLSAMEGAGKLVEDEDLAEAMKDKGLGTPATRAQIIDHVIREKYLDREHKELIPTPKAEHLVEFLEAVNVEELTSPAMTGEWEYKLHQIEKKELTRDAFMNGIIKMTEHIVEQTKQFDENTNNTKEIDIIAPTDGKPLVETIRAYRSQSGDFSINKVLGNRRMEPEEVRILIQKRTLGPLDGFRSKSGRPFSAVLELDQDNKVKFVFDAASSGDDEAKDLSDLTQFEMLGRCPKAARGLCPHAQGSVLEMPTSYSCEHQVKKEDGCDFRVSRNLLGRLIEKDQFLKLMNEGKTDLLDKFKSKRTGRFFSAHLVLKDNAQIGFEFAQKKGDAQKNASSQDKPAKSASAKKTATKKTTTKKQTTKKTTKAKS